MIHAVRYVMITGCQWRQILRDFPPWKMIYSWNTQLKNIVLFKRGKAFETFEFFNAIVGHNKVIKILFELLMIPMPGIKQIIDSMNDRVILKIEITIEV